ncbi:MAG: recombinase family protein [Tabrizicola sp.]|nr:recombinase family protein [Tabrizicola sp.]
MLADIRAKGHSSLRAIAAELTARGIKTRRGGAWGAGNVRGLQRLLRQ